MIASPNTQHATPELAALLTHCVTPEQVKIAEAARQLYDDSLTSPVVKSSALNAANILLEYGMDAAAVCAVLLQALPKHDSAVITARYGNDVATLVQAVLKTREVSEMPFEIEAGRHADRSEAARLEGLRKMLLAMADDVRAVLILLALQLQTMRDMADKNPNQQQNFARQTLDLFAPLASRLGIWQVKWELEDLSFRYLEPELYQKICSSNA